MNANQETIGFGRKFYRRTSVRRAESTQFDFRNLPYRNRLKLLYKQDNGTNSSEVASVISLLTGALDQTDTGTALTASIPDNVYYPALYAFLNLAGKAVNTKERILYLSDDTHANVIPGVTFTARSKIPAALDNLQKKHQDIALVIAENSLDPIPQTNVLIFNKSTHPVPVVSNQSKPSF